MKGVFMPKDVQKAIARQMSRTQRSAWKSGSPIEVTITRFGRPLKRWGAEENKCRFTAKKNSVLKSNLEEMAWNYDPAKAFREAVDAISYFVYGDRDEYKIDIRVMMTAEDLKRQLISESERGDVKIVSVEADDYCGFLTVLYDNDEGIRYQYEPTDDGWNVYHKLITPGTTWNWSDAMVYA